MQLTQAIELANGVRKHLALHGVDISNHLARDAVAVGLGDVSWAAYKKSALTPRAVQALDLRPMPSLDVLTYLGEPVASEWGRALTSPNSFGKLFIVVADSAEDAEQAAVASSVVLQQKGRAVRRLDFGACSNRAEVENVFSGLGQSGADTALLSGLQDVEDYDILWSLLRSNWQVLVRVDSGPDLGRLFARTGLSAESKQMGRMLGLKRAAEATKPSAYLY